MNIPLASRYADGHYSRSFPNPRATTKNQDVIPVVVRSTTSASPVSKGYVWKYGDRWDLVASLFGIPKSDWWVLLDVNPQIEFPFAMTPGDVINIPDSVRRRTS